MTEVTAVTFSRGIARIPYLPQLLGIDHLDYRPRFAAARNSRARLVIGWGLKANTQIAREHAARHDLPFLTVEDGFLRSVGLGVAGSPPLSVVVDDLGIYYDATRPSRLEQILCNVHDDLPNLPPFRTLRQAVARASGDPLDDPALTARARRCINRIVAAHLSKYNASPDLRLPPSDAPRVLVVDQTAGDLSITHGLASADSFTQMLDAALAEHPTAEILVKIHPDVIAGKKHSHLAAAAEHPRVRLLSDDINPIGLLQQVKHVYVVTSQLGFEALLVGKPVTCFGAPFYAGWGLTDDRVTLPRRQPGNAPRRSIEQLFAAAYILYARYRDAEDGSPSTLEECIDHLARQRHFHHANSGTLLCYGFTLWKRAYVRRYLYAPWNDIHFVSWPWQLRRRLSRADARLVVWGMRDSARLQRLARNGNIPIWRMEDGFLRSVGLGSDLTAPASLVLDKQGIYFDPTGVSDLEAILQEQTFSPELLERARRLRTLLIEANISKYNVGEQQPLRHEASPGQRIILVPGQVEADASIRLGCQDIRSNAALLQAVREDAPDAYIIYKPHPDVLSGNRKGQKKIAKNLNFDQLVTDTSITQCLDVVDEVHTMTSLVGFEGLLRGKGVTTYGLPFYAGWGLTRDKYTLPRRKRTLTLAELIAGCMLLYPRYIHGHSQTFSTPERAIRVLEQQRSTATHETRISAPTISRLSVKFVNILRGLMHGK